MQMVEIQNINNLPVSPSIHEQHAHYPTTHMQVSYANLSDIEQIINSPITMFSGTLLKISSVTNKHRHN